MSASTSLSPDELLRRERRERRIKQFETYRSEDKHECGLLVQRSAALLTSQSFLVAAVAIFYHSDPRPDRQFLNLIAFLALSMAATASFAICIGCKVLAMWHKYGSAMILADKGATRNRKDSPADDFLRGMYLPSRDQPDWRHRFSMDLFHLAMPIIFGIAWATFLWFNTKQFGRSVILVSGAVWLSGLILAWVRAGYGFNPQPEEL